MTIYCDGAKSLRDSAAIKVLHMIAYNGALWVMSQQPEDIRRNARAHAYDFENRDVPALAFEIERQWLLFAARKGRWYPAPVDGSPYPDMQRIAHAGRLDEHVCPVLP